MAHTIIEEASFKYVETGEGKVLLLLHGLFGALSNFEDLIAHFSTGYKIVVPLLPIFDLPVQEVSVDRLAQYVAEFVEFKNYDKVNLIGNSLGGHIALIYTLNHPEKVNTMTLTGSSGLFENAMGNSFPKRGDYEFIKNKTEATFYDPKVASKELVDEVFDIVNDRNKAIRIIATSKSAIRHNLEDELIRIKTPSLLIWGKNDVVTPAFVGEKFHELLENSELVLIDECGHAPMMERPEPFNLALTAFLDKH